LNSYQERKTEISIKVNGSGIPQIIVEFFPIFSSPTNRPGGGIELCLDIIKAPGGEIKAETKIDE
jgi:nitrogen-specific signal transduction histidine kinase